MTTEDRLPSDYIDKLDNSTRSQAHGDARLLSAPLTFIPLPARCLPVTIKERDALAFLPLTSATIHMPPPWSVAVTDTAKD